MASLLLLAIGILGPVALGQQTEWEQCGGLQYTGVTTCAAGLVCFEQNPYYYQCLPGTASTTSTSKTSTSSTTLLTSTTSKTSRSSSSSSSSTSITSTTSKVSSTSTSTSSSATAAATGWDYFITFGDSYSQTGFEITLAHASASDPLGNPTFPGYTTTNGDNWIDFLIATYNKTRVLSYNFAYGGATTDASLVAPYESTVLSFVNQTSEFTANLVPAPSFAPWTASNTLFGVWIGVNDVGNAWYFSNWSTLAETIIAHYISQVQIMYNSGARNFLFLTVPPIQYTPLVVAEGSTTVSEEGAGVAYYNQLLVAAIATFKEANEGVTTYVYDTTVPFMQAIDDPTAYGAPNATCYNADGVSCLWWNDYHPGQAIHRLVAEGVAALTGI